MATTIWLWWKRPTHSASATEQTAYFSIVHSVRMEALFGLFAAGNMKNAPSGLATNCMVPADKNQSFAL
eukprot:8547615-Ditylum_brightwellii.AAC.1